MKTTDQRLDAIEYAIREHMAEFGADMDGFAELPQPAPLHAPDNEATRTAADVAREALRDLDSVSASFCERGDGKWRSWAVTRDEFVRVRETHARLAAELDAMEAGEKTDDCTECGALRSWQHRMGCSLDPAPVTDKARDHRGICRECSAGPWEHHADGCSAVKPDPDPLAGLQLAEDAIGELSMVVSSLFSVEALIEAGDKAAGYHARIFRKAAQSERDRLQKRLGEADGTITRQQ
jgi:hypothetical protein